MATTNSSLYFKATKLHQNSMLTLGSVSNFLKKPSLPLNMRISTGWKPENQTQIRSVHAQCISLKLKMKKTRSNARRPLPLSRVPFHIIHLNKNRDINLVMSGGNYPFSVGPIFSMNTNSKLINCTLFWALKANLEKN